MVPISEPTDGAARILLCCPIPSPIQTRTHTHTHLCAAPIINILRVGGSGEWVMGIEEGTFWDEHWVLYGNRFDNKFHILKIKKK